MRLLIALVLAAAGTITFIYLSDFIRTSERYSDGMATWDDGEEAHGK